MNSRGCSICPLHQAMLCLYMTCRLCYYYTYQYTIGSGLKFENYVRVRICGHFLLIDCSNITLLLLDRHEFSFTSRNFPMNISRDCIHGTPNIWHHYKRHTCPQYCQRLLTSLLFFSSKQPVAWNRYLVYLQTTTCCLLHVTNCC